ncbi:MAG: DNA starvation/stationary phase protection protein Dps [Myxococcales bacterium]|nr:DNA starvation/stationary phase protection protein Dps [Myxococcales bacterium]
MPRFITRIEIPTDVREKMTTLLNQQLADTFDLYTQTKQAHWTVHGKQFHALHTFFDEFAAQLSGYSDDLAERVAIMGGEPRGTARMIAAQSRLDEFPLEMKDGMDYVTALANRTAKLTQSTRRAIDAASEYGDETTADLFTEITRGLDKSLWFLEGHLR